MDQIIKELETYSGKFPEQALQEASLLKDKITPILLATLDRVLQKPAIAVDQNYMLHLYSLFSLAQFREKKAFPKIIALVSLPADIVESMLGDAITEDLPNILYSTYDDDLNALEEIVENPNVGIFVRGSALEVISKVYLETGNQEDLLTYLRQFIAKPFEDPEVDEAFIFFIQGLIADHGLIDMLDDMKKLYDQDRICASNFGNYNEFVRWVLEGHGGRLKFVTSAIDEMSWWACFQ